MNRITLHTFPPGPSPNIHMRSHTILFKTVFALNLAMFMFTAGVLASPRAEQDVASKIAEYMNAAVEVERFSGAVIVIDDEKIVYEGGFGLANREHNVPNTAATKFRLGSVTKPLTAMAIMLLQERGKVSVTDPVSKHLTDTPETWRDITIHHLLTHTSGIPNYTEFPDLETMLRTLRMPATVDQVIDSFREKPLDFQPGKEFSYSNSGYIVLGKIIEIASGQSYEAFMREAIFGPLGMKDTGYDRSEVILPGRAQGYQGRGDNVENAPFMDMSWPYAAGGIYSTVRDMARWFQALSEEKLLSDESYKAMYTPCKDDYACGWIVRNRGDRRMLSHGGGIHGFQSTIVRFPDEGIGVVVLSNVIPSEVGRIANDLAGIALGDEVAIPKALVEAKINPASFDALAGKYQLAPGKIVSFRREGDRYFTQITGQDELEIFPSSETEYFLKVAKARVTFVKDEQGRATHVILHQGGRTTKAPRIDDESSAGAE